MSTINEKLVLANENVPKVYAAGAGGIDLSNYVKKTDVATSEQLGLVKIPVDSGIEIETDGGLCVNAATEAEITARTETCKPIVPATLDYAVRSVRPNVVELSDLDVDITCELNTIYTTNYSAPETLKITLPSTGQYGDFIQVDFYSGDIGTINTSLTVLSPTAGLEGYDLNVEAGCIYSLYFDWGCTHSGTNGCGWRFGYSSYPYEEV